MLVLLNGVSNKVTTSKSLTSSMGATVAEGVVVVSARKESGCDLSFTLSFKSAREGIGASDDLLNFISGQLGDFVRSPLSL